jgi:hypothetical protein
LGATVGTSEGGLSIGFLEGLVSNGEIVGDSVVGSNVGELVLEVVGVKVGGVEIGIVVKGKGCIVFAVGVSVGLRVGEAVCVLVG